MVAPSPLLVLTNQLSLGGAERLLVESTRWLAEQGVRVEVAATPGELVDELAPAVRFHPVPLHDGRSLDPRSLARLWRIVRALRPALIVANSAATVLAARAVAPQIPCVALAHGWPRSRYPVVAPILRTADAVVAVSPDVARHLLERGLSPRAVHVVPNGIDLTRFGPRSATQLAAARRALGADGEDIAIVNVGRHVAQKRQERLIDAAASLARTHPRLRWTLIGHGPRAAELRTRALEAGVADRITFLGRRDDVPDLLMAADLYVSTSDWEGLPLATIEAMAAGLAVISTDVEGIGTLLGDDVGVRVPVGDHGALVAAIGRLAEDEPERLRRGSLARAAAERSFGREGMLQRLAGVFASIAGEAPTSSP